MSVRFMTKEGGYLVRSGLHPFTFPMGEAHTKLDANRTVGEHEVALVQFAQNTIHDDLFQLAMWHDLLRRHSGTRRSVLMPYLPGARADRGTPHGAGVYADFLSSMLPHVDDFVAFDVHSGLAKDTYSDLLFHGVSTATLTALRPDEVLADLHTAFPRRNGYKGVVAPDKGAVERTTQVGAALDLPVFCADKTREFETGKLTGYSFDASGLSDGDRLLVVDDICDGGGTFLLLADAVAETGLDITLDLYVSHGIFSKGVAPLLDRYENVYTTNSISRTGHVQGLHVVDVFRPMVEAVW